MIEFLFELKFDDSMQTDTKREIEIKLFKFTLIFLSFSDKSVITAMK
jgi:hypothetical protein